MERLRRLITIRSIIGLLIGLLIVALAIVLLPLAFAGPQIVAISPASGSSDANPQAPIRVEFNQWVTLASVQDAVKLSPPVDFSVVQTDTLRPWRAVLLIQPRGGLAYGARYQLTIDGSVRNVLGRTLGAPQTVAFNTAPYVRVIAFAPAKQAEDVSLNTPITVEFNAPVVSAEQISAAANDPALADRMPQPLTLQPAAKGVGRWLSPTLYGFYPEGGLGAATGYLANIGTMITPDGRARLEQPLSWSFNTAAPLLMDVRPTDNANNVPADSSIEVHLAADVDIDSASEHFVLLNEKSQVQVHGTIKPSSGGFQFTPSQPLQRSARYQAQLQPGVLSRAGYPLSGGASIWSFTGMGDLEVQQVEPPRDTVEVPTDAHRISVRFSHPVVAVTTADTSSSAPIAIRPPLQGSGRWLDTSTYVFSPTQRLQAATAYYIDVAAGLKDQTGGTLLQSYSWSFRTAAPQVVDALPRDGEQHARPMPTLQLFFNELMDADSLRAAISLQNTDSGASVPTDISFARLNRTIERYDSNGDAYEIRSSFVATITPSAALERGANYRIQVAPSARVDQGQGHIAATYSSAFRVTPPLQLQDISVNGGQTAIEPGSGSVALRFSTPIDGDSVWQNLTIAPTPTDIYTSSYDTTFSVGFAMQPETDYTITVGAGARDREGVALGQEVSQTYHTGSWEPALGFMGVNQIGMYNAYVPVRLLFHHVNLPSLSYRLYRIDPADVAPLLGSYDKWNAFSPDSSLLVSQKTLDLQNKNNQQRADTLDLGRLDPGIYFITMGGNGGDLRDRQLLAVSPYTLTIKRSANQLFVWAVDLASGKPASGIKLQGAEIIYRDESSPDPADALIDLGSTDADGILQASFTSSQIYQSMLIWSPVGKTFAFASSGWSDGINPWDFGLTADYDGRPLAGNVTTDRPIYRPEQNVYIRGVLRHDQDGRYRLPGGGERAHLIVNDPEGNIVLSTTLPLNTFGAFNTSLPLARNAKLGSYSLIARFDGAPDSQNVFGSFTAAEYRKPSFEISVTPNKSDMVQGETLSANVSARYFSGGALAHAPIRWRVVANPLYFSPESAPNFRFEDLDDAYAWYRWFDGNRDYGGEQVADGNGQTDAQGNFIITLPATLGKDSHSRKLTISVEVTDVDGQAIDADADANVHAGDFYIGLRPDSYVAQAGQPQTVALLTLDSQGQPSPNRALSVGVYKREWFSVREQGADGRFYFTSSYTDTLVQQLSASTDAQGRGSISFTPKDGGSYRIGATGHDQAGHTIAASAFTWASGGDVFWGINDTARVDLIADKDRYAPGDTAKILVTAPYADMSALLTVERGAVIEHKLLTIKGTTQLLELPIVADYAPNIYVSLVLIKPAGGDVAVPDVRVGLVNLPVSTEQQQISISLSADKAQAGPRDQITYTVKTTDATGKGVKADVSLALVDKAVLTLLDDPNPSLLDAFYEKRPIGVITAQSLTALVDRVTLKLQPGDKGGGGGVAADVLVRRNFPDTAYWNPSLVTGDDGSASVTVTLPDSLTTWTLTARGVTASTQVGQASQETVATRPLIVRPSLPRFLTLGDTPVLQAVLHNTTASAIDATVQLDTIVPDGGQPTVQLSGPASQQINVPANGTAVVRWPATARQSGQATLRFTLTGGGLQDIAEATLPVQRFTTPEVVASAGQVLDRPVVETLQLPQATDATTSTQGEIELTLEPSLAASIGDELQSLDQYPYLCAEQTVSRFLPNAATYRIFHQLGRDDPSLKAALDRNLPAGLQRLAALQNLDGGWGWWDGDASDPYLSAYVLQGLVEARRAGYGVDAQVYTKALDYLKQQLDLGTVRTPDMKMSDSELLNTHSYMLFVLAEAGQPDRGRTVALFERRTNLQTYGRAYLLMTLKTLGQEEARIHTLIGELMASAILHTSDAHWEEAQPNYWTMSSDTRSTALALQALVRTDPNNFLIPNAVRYLVGASGAGPNAPPRLYRHTTQESAASLLALAEYIAQSGELNADYRYSATLDGKTLREGTVDQSTLADPISAVIQLADLKAGGTSQLQIARQGAQGRLYYTLRMRSFQDAAQVQPLDQGIGIQREYVAVDTDTLSPTGQLVTQAQIGDLVQVRLTLTVPEDMPYFAAEDMLPAGLEALDSSLKTVSDTARAAGQSQAEADQSYWWYFSQAEIHDNRVALFASDLPKGTYHYTYLARATTPGTFQTLPALAYRMYTPEVFGRSAGARFVVTQPGS